VSHGGITDLFSRSLRAKKTPTPKYSDTQKWYNSILGIGSDDDENEESSSDELVSVMFRRSIK
jgi:hypothetical protein